MSFIITGSTNTFSSSITIPTAYDLSDANSLMRNLLWQPLLNNDGFLQKRIQTDFLTSSYSSLSTLLSNINSISTSATASFQGISTEFTKVTASNTNFSNTFTAISSSISNISARSTSSFQGISTEFTKVTASFQGISTEFTLLSASLLSTSQSLARQIARMTGSNVKILINESFVNFSNISLTSGLQLSGASSGWTITTPINNTNEPSGTNVTIPGKIQFTCNTSTGSFVSFLTFNNNIIIEKETSSRELWLAEFTFKISSTPSVITPEICLGWFNISNFGSLNASIRPGNISAGIFWHKTAGDNILLGRHRNTLTSSIASFSSIPSSESIKAIIIVDKKNNTSYFELYNAITGLPFSGSNQSSKNISTNFPSASNGNMFFGMCASATATAPIFLLEHITWKTINLTT